MKEKEILKILKESAIKYKENLKDKNLLIIYKERTEIKYIEILFLARNFMHLTGVKCNDKNGKNMKANQFYQACLNNKLSYKDIIIKQNGTTKLKLDILSQLININKNFKMIGEYNNYKNKLVTEILLGNINMCLGLTKNTSSYYIPNTLLKEDIRKLVIKPCRIIAVLKKNVESEQYKDVIYLNKEDIDVTNNNTDLFKKINIKNNSNL